MAGQQQQGQQGSGSEVTFFLAAAISILAVFLLWNLFHKQFVYVVYAIIWLETKIVQYTIGIGEIGRNVLNNAEAVFSGKKAAESISFDTMSEMKSLIGERTKYLFVGLIGIMILVIMTKMKGGGFKRNIALNNNKGSVNFLNVQKDHWKTLSFAAKFDPDAQNENLAQSMTPFEWMKKHNITYEDGELGEVAAAYAFREQLGEQWVSLNRLKPYQRALVAMMGVHLATAKEAGNKSIGKTSENFREMLAIEYTKIIYPRNDKEKKEAEATVIAKTNEILKMKPVQKAIFEVCHKPKSKRGTKGHKFSYVSTTMIELLTRSRAEAGVLNTAMFDWLKAIDRTLFYALNNTGRRAFFIEAAGIQSHYWAEIVSGTPILEPKIDKAIEGLHMYIKTTGLHSVSEFFENLESYDFDFVWDENQ